MRTFRYLLLPLVLLCSCNEDLPTDVIDVFDTYPTPTLEYPDYWWYGERVSYSTISFYSRVWHPKRNSKWCTYYSDKPNVGPDNGTCIEMPDPFDIAEKQFLQDVGDGLEHECAQVSVNIKGLKPSTTYYYNVLYTDENGRTCFGKECSSTTKSLEVGSVVGYNTDFNSATVRFTVTACEPDEAVCHIFISDKENCPVEEARLVCSHSLKGQKFDSFNEITTWVIANDLQLSTTYYLQGYMTCLGDTVPFKPSSFRMSEFVPHSLDYSASTDYIDLFWRYRLRDDRQWNLAIPDDLPPYDFSLWFSRQPDPLNDPDAIVFHNEDLNIVTDNCYLQCSKRIDGLDPFTSYYAFARFTIQGRNYDLGPQNCRTNHTLTILDNQERATMYLKDGTAFDVVLVKAGTFMMGATAEQAAYATGDEKPAHEVTITKDFYMATCETTSRLYHAFSYGGNGEGNQPITNISHGQMEKFCSLLSGAIGYSVTMPTEAEWEYAARGGHLAGDQTLYAGSDNFSDVAVTHSIDYRDAAPDVATKQPNVLGLYDMSGNAWEACSDKYEADFYSRSPSTNPENPNTGFSAKPYVVRGGSRMPGENNTEARVSNRWKLDNDRWTTTHPYVGFRFVIRP